MKVLCVNGIPARGLHTGRLYTQINWWTCCGKYLPRVLASVHEATGSIRKLGCPWCYVRVPYEPTGWFDALRFVPWNPPQISDEEVRALYQPNLIHQTVSEREPRDSVLACLGSSQAGWNPRLPRT